MSPRCRRLRLGGVIPSTSSPPDAISMKLSSAPSFLSSLSTWVMMWNSERPGSSTSTNFFQPAAQTSPLRRIRASSHGLFTMRAASIRPVAETNSVAGSAARNALANANGRSSRWATPTRFGVASRSRSTSAAMSDSRMWCASSIHPAPSMTAMSARLVEYALGGPSAARSAKRGAAQNFRVAEIPDIFPSPARSVGQEHIEVLLGHRGTQLAVAQRPFLGRRIRAPRASSAWTDTRS